MSQHEQGVRTVHINGVPVSVSKQQGGLIVWVKPDQRGKIIDLESYSYGHKKGNIVAYKSRNRQVFAAVFNRLDSGSYTVKGKQVGTYSWNREETTATITANWVEQVDWR